MDGSVDNDNKEEAVQSMDQQRWLIQSLEQTLALHLTPVPKCLLEQSERSSSVFRDNNASILTARNVTILACAVVFFKLFIKSKVLNVVLEF